MSFRRNQRKKVNVYDPERVFKFLPDDLRSYDLWLYSETTGKDGLPGGAATGLLDHREAVHVWLDKRFGDDPQRPDVASVCDAGGLTAAVWFERMFANEPRLRAV